MGAADPAAMRAAIGVADTTAVDTNADKLALVGVPLHTIVDITDEANRIEMFKGGDASLDANWLVLRNTIDLSVNDWWGYDVMTINGITTVQFVNTYVGWVDAAAVQVTTAGSLVPWEIYTVNGQTGFSSSSQVRPINNTSLSFDRPLPPRAAVRITSQV